MSGTKRIAVFGAGLIALIVIGLIGAFMGGEASRERNATPGPADTPVESIAGCPWGEASCVLALGIERALQFGNVDAVVRFGVPDFYDCPGRPQQAPDEPFPLCEGAPEFTRREGFELKRRFDDASVVETEGMRAFVQRFVDSVDPGASDDLGDGQLRLYAFGCPSRATPFQNVSCARLAIIFSAIVGEADEAHRELLVFWAIGNYGGETLPVTEVWDGIVLDSERPILFESGGQLSDLGEVYVISQALREDRN